MQRRTKSLVMAGLFAALADTTRLRLLNLIAGHEICVCHLVEVLGQSQPKISRHLAYLRKAGIVTARREGKWMHYSVSASLDALTRSILATVLAALGADAQMKAERAKLNSLQTGCVCLPEPLPGKGTACCGKRKSA